MKQLLPVTIVLLAVISLSLSGCGSNSTSPTPSSDPAPETAHEGHGQNHQDHAADMEMGVGQSDMDKMRTELAKLSSEDRTAAEKQHVCPVSGKMLGTMGSPHKIEVDGQQVWLCCPGCEGQLRENPEQFLAKLQK